MRYRSRILRVLIVVIWAWFSSPAKADVDISIFVNALSPYGTWVNHSLYGQVWFPRGVPQGWRPYTDGHWVYTLDYGWVWESDWDWGWAPFHYGRWAWDDWYGWIWIPGRVWAPAWVYWRFGGGFVAWAPMSPDVLWRSGFGLHSPRFNVDRDLPWDFWNCVEARHFPERRIQQRILVPSNNINIINVTQNVTNVTVVNNRIVNRSISLQPIEHAFGRRIPAERIREVDDLAKPHGEPRPGELTVIRPRLVEALPPGDEREQEKLVNRIAEDRQIRRLAQPEQFKPRVPRRLLEPQPEGEAGRQEAPAAPPPNLQPSVEQPHQLQERDQRQPQEFQRQPEQQQQREEQMQRQQEMERRTVEQRRQVEQLRQSQERDQRQQQQEFQRQQEMERRAIEQQRQEEQQRQIQERDQRQQEQQRQREEQMLRQQESERRAVEQRRQVEQLRQSQERDQRQQQQEFQRQREQQRQREEQMQRQQESEHRSIEQPHKVEQARQLQERAKQQQKELQRQQQGQ